MDTTNNLLWKHIITPGRVAWYPHQTPLVHCRIEVTTKPLGEGVPPGKVLSITGVIGAKPNGDCVGSTGQIQSDLRAALKGSEFEFHPEWNEEKVRKFLDIWDKWHLNDKRAGCEHQRAQAGTGEAWDTSKLVELVDFTYGPKWKNLKRAVEEGKASTEEYLEFVEMLPKIHNAVIAYTRPQYFSPENRSLCAAGWIEPSPAMDGTSKAAGWVRYESHPEGLLCKPCEVCGYKYGTQWLFEEIPEEVLEWLRTLPAATHSCPWNGYKNF